MVMMVFDEALLFQRLTIAVDQIQSGKDTQSARRRKYMASAWYGSITL